MAAMLVVMYRMRKQLNKALEYAGGESLKTDSYYWSSSEYSANNSWGLGASSGSLYIFGKCNSGYVRPCTSFNL